MARMEQAIKNIVEVYLEYADSDGKLNKEEMKKLLEKEFENPEVKAKLCSGKLEKVIGRLDKNRDGELNFKEFCLVVGFMTRCHYHKKTGKDQEED